MFVQLSPKFGLNYKAGHLFFTRNDRRVVSNGIAWFTGKESIFDQETHRVTHVGICISETEGVEMQFGGFAKCSMQDYFTDPHTRIIFREPKLLDQVGIDPLMAEIAEWLKDAPKYDFGLIAGMILTRSRVWGRFLPEKAKDWIIRGTGSSKARICSEAVQILCREGCFHDQKVERITPQQLFQVDWLKPLRTLKVKHDKQITEGEGLIWIPCPKCNGVGVQIDTDAHRSVECKKCKGKRIVRRP